MFPCTPSSVLAFLYITIALGVLTLVLVCSHKVAGYVEELTGDQFYPVYVSIAFVTMLVATILHWVCWNIWGWL